MSLSRTAQPQLCSLTLQRPEASFDQRSTIAILKASSFMIVDDFVV